jgi:hypothetical protein
MRSLSPLSAGGQTGSVVDKGPAVQSASLLRPLRGRKDHNLKT